MIDLEKLEALAKKASIGCKGKCSGERPSYCDECEARDMLSLSYDEVLSLIAELRAARMLVQWVRCCEAQPDEIYCDVNPEDCDHCLGMEFLADYDEAVMGKS